MPQLLFSGMFSSDDAAWTDRMLPPLLALVMLIAGACSQFESERAATTTSTLPPAPPPADELDWERITDEAMLPSAGTAFAAIMAKQGGGWVIAGAVLDDERVPQPHLWESSDGLAWDAESVDGFDEGAFIYDATWHGPSGYVVGSLPSTGPTPGLLLRVGEDGAIEPLDLPELGDSAGLALTYVASHPDQGILALGHTDPDPDVDWVALSSIDGVRWSRQPMLEDLVNQFETGWVSAVEVGSAGRLVVVSDESDSGVDEGHVLYDDGSGWDDRGTLPAEGGIVVEDALVTDDGPSVYGATQTALAHEPAIWRAGPNGGSWQRIEPDIQIRDWHTTVNAYGWSFIKAIRTPGGYAGVVFAASSYVFVRSADGIRWTEVPLPQSIFDTDVPYPGSLDVGQDGLMAVSTSSLKPAVFAISDETASQVLDPGLPEPGDILTMSESLAVGDDVLVVGSEQLWSSDLSGEATQRAITWTVKGDTSERSELPGGNLFSLQGARVLTDGRTAMVGYEYFAESIVNQRNISSGVWFRDGDEVTTVDSDTFQADGLPRMFGIAELSDGTLVVIGTRYLDNADDDNQRVTFWVSTDGGATWESIRDPEFEETALNPEISDICPLPGGGAIGIAGYGADGSTPAVWLTGDGQSWETSVTDEEPFGGEVTTLNSCDADTERTYVVGASGSPHTAALWTTVDGRTFERLDDADFGDFTAVWDIEVFADGGIWLVGPIAEAEGSGAGTIAELDRDGNVEQLERLDGPEFISPTGFANVWSITGSVDNVILLGDFGGGVAVWRAPVP